MPGPNLSGLIGRKIGSDPAFDYSPALRKARDDDLLWDASRLEAFLADPAEDVSGTLDVDARVSRMPPSGSRWYGFWQNPPRVDG